MRRPLLLGLLVLVAAVPAVACGDEERPAAPESGANVYPQEVVDTFLTSCQSQPGASREVCGCVLDEIRQRYTFDEFRRADAALRRGEASGIDLETIGRGCASSGDGS